MKKIIFFIAFLLLYGICYCQTNKTGKSVTKPESELVKENAEKWFKDVYVEQFFI